MSVTAWGVDYSEGLDIATLKQYNAKFACRYIGFTSQGLPQTKILTASEVQTLQGAGIDIVSNWEWTGNPNTEGANIGIWTAQQAAQLHANLGGGGDRPIYFSIDYNSPGYDVAWYFQEIAQVIGLNRVGAYGGYNCIKYLLDNNLIKWAWQTYAWSGTALDPRAHIYQYLNGVTLNGMTMDYDNALQIDYGQWGYHPQDVSKFMDKQFTDVYTYGVNLGNGAIDTGLATMYHNAFKSHLMPSCYASTPELDTVDWSGNPIKFQYLSNGYHGEWNNGVGHLYDPYGKRVV